METYILRTVGRVVLLTVEGRKPAVSGDKGVLWI